MKTAKIVKKYWGVMLAIAVIAIIVFFAFGTEQALHSPASTSGGIVYLIEESNSYYNYKLTFPASLDKIGEVSSVFGFSTGAMGLISTPSDVTPSQRFPIDEIDLNIRVCNSAGNTASYNFDSLEGECELHGGAMFCSIKGSVSASDNAPVTICGYTGGSVESKIYKIGHSAPIEEDDTNTDTEDDVNGEDVNGEDTETNGADTLKPKINFIIIGLFLIIILFIIFIIFKLIRKK